LVFPRLGDIFFAFFAFPKPKWQRKNDKMSLKWQRKSKMTTWMTKKGRTNDNNYFCFSNVCRRNIFLRPVIWWLGSARITKRRGGFLAIWKWVWVKIICLILYFITISWE
jgi:hypothetical protein